MPTTLGAQTLTLWQQQAIETVLVLLREALADKMAELERVKIAIQVIEEIEFPRHTDAGRALDSERDE